jgi:hypothetical protein
MLTARQCSLGLGSAYKGDNAGYTFRLLDERAALTLLYLPSYVTLDNRTSFINLLTPTDLIIALGDVPKA